MSSITIRLSFLLLLLHASAFAAPISPSQSYSGALGCPVTGALPNKVDELSGSPNLSPSLIPITHIVDPSLKLDMGGDGNRVQGAPAALLGGLPVLGGGLVNGAPQFPAERILGGNPLLDRVSALRPTTLAAGASPIKSVDDRILGATSFSAPVSPITAPNSDNMRETLGSASTSALQPSSGPRVEASDSHNRNGDNSATSAPQAPPKDQSSGANNASNPPSTAAGCANPQSNSPETSGNSSEQRNTQGSLLHVPQPSSVDDKLLDIGVTGESFLVEGLGAASV